MKICPFCAEDIQDAAIVCKHCRRDLPHGNQITTNKAQARSTVSIAGILGLLVLVVGFIGAAILPGRPTAARRSVSAITASQGSQLIVLARPSTDVIRLTNDTDELWSRCEIEIAGGYTAQLATFLKRENGAVFYRDFAAGATPMNPAEGYARAIRDLRMECRNADGQTTRAQLR